MATPAVAALPKTRKQPQPRNFKDFIITFSDGTFFNSNQTDLMHKIQQAQKIIEEPENKGKLTFEIRGISRKIISVRQKQSRPVKYDAETNNVSISLDKKDTGLQIVYEE